MSITLPAIRKILRVPLPPHAAFELFTSGLPDWWPVESHSLSAREGKLPMSVAFDTRLGGRIVEQRHDGSTGDWAEVTGWAPGRRLALAWHVGRARSDATRIDVEFLPHQDGGSEVTLIHSGFEVLGPAGEAAANNYDEGWDVVLGDRFRLACGN